MSEDRELPRVTYDAEADAAYIYLTSPTDNGSVTRTIFIHDVGASIDLDEEGRIRGVEILGAQHTLPVDLLARLT